MKLPQFKASIDAYFETADPQEIIARFEALGYVFEDIKPKHQSQAKNGRNLEKWKRKQIRRKLIILSNKIGVIPHKPPKPNE